MDWDDLRIVLAVVRQGSLSAAARTLSSTQPTVGRRLDAFEQALGVKLFERGAGGLTPTPLCAALTESLERMEEGALAIERRVAARDTGLEGNITVTSIDWLGDYVVAPLLARFGAQHPLVSLDLINDRRRFNLARHEADIAIRFGSFDEESLIERKVADVSYAMYASQAYLEAHGTPDFAVGGAGHAVVLLNDLPGKLSLSGWLCMVVPEARRNLRTNSIRSQLAVVEAGEALAVLPRILADARPMLRRVATPRPGPVLPLRLGVHADLRETPRIRAFIDYAVRELERRASELNPA
ncbi:LysR family transcriptional regulator [Corallococcus sp. M34]|uniref:LysR family transcriptional regulator n=1 Tax=Citreicoccus inhibens TaxID=2849499 RepID=UPI0013152432|nr:LysR family transcriptional regulator [Citreicoccus inhibens]MBU8895317.1 LysR family transcriptional regulator [Citreicoccus inhibens]